MLQLFDGNAHFALQPLSFTRPVANLRIGVQTIAEKWSACLHEDYSYLSQDYLQVKYPIQIAEQNTYINGSICPNEALIMAINRLKHQEALYANHILIAFKYHEKTLFNLERVASLKKISFEYNFIQIQHPEDIIKYNAIEIVQDIERLKIDLQPYQLANTNTHIGKELYLSKNVTMHCCTLNTTEGPIFIDEEASIMEGCHLRGPLYIGKNTVVKMGSRIYGGTSVGPFCTVGGEIKNALFYAYSNKGHDGYLGDSVIGEWCNIGADSNNSNMKNNYATVKLWDYPTQKMRDTGMTFLGLIMADHSKCGINSMFNTGTVIGVSCNIFDAGFPAKYVPDFSWGSPLTGFNTYRIEKAIETAELAYNRKKMKFESPNKLIFNEIFNQTKTFRNNK